MDSLSDTAILEMLGSLPDDTLRAVHSECGRLIEERNTVRLREAVAAARRIGREIGVTIKVTKPDRKRGRPRKIERGLIDRDSADRSRQHRHEKSRKRP